MKKEILNGTPIPYDLPIEDLKVMMASSTMKNFSLACEALSYKNDPDAYEIMKSYINDKDKYRRLYILKTIFRHREAAELFGILENAILSEDLLFVHNALTIISEYRIKISDAALLSAISKHLPKLYTELFALRMLDINEDNYGRLVELFGKAEECCQKEFIGEILMEKHLPSKAEELFELFKQDGFAKIRLLAVKLADKYGYDLSQFLRDIDGHVKKFVAKSLGELSFLTKYSSRYRIDVSDDLESAIIYNPVGEEHIYIEYDKADEFSPYMVSFSNKHRHEADQESVVEWIDNVLEEDSRE